MPDSSPRIALVCAPAGCGFKEAVNQLGKLLRDQHGEQAVAIQDVEDVLCEKDGEASHALRGRIPDNRQISMREVTYHLPAPQVIRLWQAALRRALKFLTESTAAIRLLACHLNLYSARRREFYSPFDTAPLQEVEISHVMLLIDDVFDMYRRLSTRDHIYDEAKGVRQYSESIWEEEGKTGEPEFTAPTKRNLELEWKIGVLSSLLAWRHSEMMVAESLARQLRASYTVFGTKQLASAACRWLTNLTPGSVYLSHPISRPRKVHRRQGEWPDVVTEFNQLQERLLRQELVAIMPTAIDEYRLARSRWGGELTPRFPKLDSRWPLPGDDNNTPLLYSDSRDGPEHTFLLMPEDYADDARWNAQLRLLEAAVKAEIPFRDHQLVVANHHLLIYRPLFQDGRFSSGVSAEIAYWADLSETEPDRNRRAVFLHLKVDVQVLLVEARKSSDYSRLMHQELEQVLRDRGLDTEHAKRSADAVIQGNRPQLLDAGPDITTEDATDLRQQVHRAALGELLTASQLSNPRADAWILDSFEELDTELPRIVKFLRGECERPRQWEARCPELEG